MKAMKAGVGESGKEATMLRAQIGPVMGVEG
jgi:hypothetical protein